MNSAGFASVSSRRLLEYALLMIARQHGGDPVTARAAEAELAIWRQAAPAHEAAAQAALRGWGATEAPGLRGTVPLPPTSAVRAASRRRFVMSVLGVAGVAVLVGAAGRWHWMQPLEQLVLQTKRGQEVSHKLQDGSQLNVAPRTTAQATLYRDRREVRLAEGEVRFEVKRDASRPFEVVTDWGRVRVLGTSFSVAVREGRMTVSVAHGRVAVWSGQGADRSSGRPDVELGAGQKVATTASGLGEVNAVAADDVGAWRNGWLVFDRAPLAEVVARWNDYLTQPLTLAPELADGAAMGGLRLTGSFPLRDPDAFITSLPNVLPVQVSRAADGGQVIRARPTLH
jgi:transmembrane sensor